MIETTTTTQDRSMLERLLNIFANVHAREGVTGLLLLSNIFLILLAYYFIKPVREGWLSVSVITGLSKLEVKAYSAFAQSLILLAILPLYSMVAARVTRRRLILYTGIVSVGCLMLFWLMQPGMLADKTPYSGVLFYIFVGIFSVTLVAQFWSFASDVYGVEKGKRLFPLVAVGATSGAMVGSWVGERLLRLNWLSTFDLILLAIIPIGAAIALAYRVDKRESQRAPHSLSDLVANPKPSAVLVAPIRKKIRAIAARQNQPAAPKGEGPFRQIFSHRYLSAAALLMLLFSWVVASGDNLLFGMVQSALEIEFGEKPDPTAYSAYLKQATTAFYGDLYFWINFWSLFLQAFIVSRLMKLGGFGLLLTMTPLVSLIANVSMAIAPLLGVIKTVKIAENASNYSINNTARHMLWLPTSKSMLYQAKTTADTLFVRLGDGLAALTVLIGTRLLDFSLLQFLTLNITLSLFWFLLAIYIFTEYRKWEQQTDNANQ